MKPGQIYAKGVDGSGFDLLEVLKVDGEFVDCRPLRPRWFWDAKTRVLIKRAILEGYNLVTSGEQLRLFNA